MRPVRAANRVSVGSIVISPHQAPSWLKHFRSEGRTVDNRRQSEVSPEVYFAVFR